MTKDEALKMAIAFMETLTIDVGIKTWNEKHRKEAVNACYKALEQPAQEPVAWMHETYTDGQKLLEVWFDTQEHKADDTLTIPLYTHPHQWQGLTELEQWNLINKSDIPADYDHELLAIARAIEQALKEKNHD